MSSSRQSPKMSAVRLGYPPPPAPSAVKMGPTLYLSIRLPESNCRVRPPSHQITQPVEEGIGPMESPFILSSPYLRWNHISAPGFEGSISSATPPPMSSPMAPFHKTFLRPGLYNDAPGPVSPSSSSSWTVNTSNPGLSMSRSLTCMASP